MIPLMYHDVVIDGDYAGSGSSIEGADSYKLDRGDFAQHLAAIRTAVGAGPALLTFDDGGVSAYDPIAGMLEQYGWRGSFFITTDWIGGPGFLNADQIRELDRRGHTIGSHSCSHPIRMAAEPRERMVLEWRESIDRLQSILDHPVKIASVPGGYYSREVAEAAAAAGIETLYTSEPTAGVHVVNGCRVLGRYALKRGMGPEWAAGLAAGKFRFRFRQALGWNLKKTAKLIAAGPYLRVRKAILR